MGLKVTTTDGIELGVIDDIVAMPAHDVIKIGELLIPAVEEFVKEDDYDDTYYENDDENEVPKK